MILCRFVHFYDIVVQMRDAISTMVLVEREHRTLEDQIVFSCHARSRGRNGGRLAASSQINPFASVAASSLDKHPISPPNYKLFEAQSLSQIGSFWVLPFLKNCFLHCHWDWSGCPFYLFIMFKASAESFMFRMGTYTMISSFFWGASIDILHTVPF